MKRGLKDYDRLRGQVALAFFKYVNLFNLLERNIVLCISGLHNGPDREAVMARLAGLTMHGKMEALRTLITDGQVTSDRRRRDDFDRWFQFAVKSKASRNRYVHGCWDVIPHLEKPIRFEANQWYNGKSGALTTEEMTLDEFLRLMNEMAEVFDQFSVLRRRHGL